MIIKTTEITQNDIFRLRIIYFRVYKLKYLFGAAILFVLFNLVAFALKGEDLLGKEFFIFTLLSFALILCLPLLIGLYYYVAGRVKKETVVFQHPLTYIFTETDLQISGYKTNTTSDWSDFYNYMEDKNAFYLFISSVQAYIIPKRYFSNEEIKNVRNLLEKNVIKRSVKGIRIVTYIFSGIFFLGFIATLISIFQNN
ncbi:MAG: YcxB family protein [Candidatus Azobacteroides sp.]|nr:YcxB family protein [Candidatus Azobacteroides sp.]